MTININVNSDKTDVKRNWKDKKNDDEERVIIIIINFCYKQMCFQLNQKVNWQSGVAKKRRKKKKLPFKLLVS